MIEDKQSDVYRSLLVGAEIVISAGIHEEEGAEGRNGATLSNAELGAFHEFGTSEIPQRSFIRAFVDENQELIDSWITDAANAILNGEDPEVAAERVALLMESGIKERILNGLSPGLSEATLKRREGGIPLVDTAQLLGSILGKVQR